MAIMIIECSYRPVSQGLDLLWLALALAVALLGAMLTIAGITPALMALFPVSITAGFALAFLGVEIWNDYKQRF